MVKKSIKKGSKLVCVPCGREVIVDECGMSERTIWCCGKPMKKGSASPKKKKTKSSRKKK